MRQTLCIARYEFLSLFASPIAWLMLIVFIVQSSIAYLNMVNVVVVGQFQGLSRLSVTASLFENDNIGVYANVAEYALIYVPLLTMGLLSREVSSGTIKLLQSSPVGDMQIVLGKYFAIVSYFGLFVLYLIFLVCFTGALTPKFSYLSAFHGALGVFLLMAAYAAVGLFMSSLTRHQVVAAVSTLAILAVLSFIGSVGQRVPVLNEVAFWLSSEVRVNSFVEGLFTSKDAFYFLLIIVLFVGLTYIKLSGAREVRSRVHRSLLVSSFIGALLAMGVLTSSPHLTFYYDTTPNDRNSPRGEIPDIVSRSGGPVHITAFINVLDNKASNFLPSERHSLERRFLDDLRRYNPSVSTEYVLYYAPSDNEFLYSRYPGETDRQIAERFARENRIDFDNIISASQVRERLGLQRSLTKPFYVLGHEGGSVFIPTFDDPTYHPNRLQYATALKTIEVGAVRVGVLGGSGERSAFLNGPNEFVSVLTQERNRFSMTNRGFDFEQVSLRPGLVDRFSLLIVADPSIPYTPEQLSYLSEYVEGGGDLLLLVEPERADATAAVLRILGLSLSDVFLRQASDEVASDIVFVAVDSDAQEVSSMDLPRFLPASRVFADGQTVPPSRSVAFLGGGVLSVEEELGFQTVPVLRADPRSVSIEGESRDRDLVSGYLLLRSNGSREQRIAVIADADLMSSALFDNQSIGVHGTRGFIGSLFKWFSRDRFPINTDRAAHPDTEMQLDLRQTDYLKIGFYWVLPALLVVSAALFLVRRRRA